ncbi:MAG: Asp-tRNA(Asn)/Glu-tRNA(Gln) amidotransferase subunit GatA [Candidatus Pelagibacter sp.]|nr:Asp-tRNA(Asn)/Glu-tRNA(Gln) amidotransferase subunit GatA [Candidatus Pelagibacter sp.]
MSEITKLTLVELTKKIKSKELSALETANAYVSRVKKSKKLNTFITETLDQALVSAKNIDDNNLKSGVLAGAPIAVKDLFCTKNVQTTASSKILKNFIPPYESTVTSKLWDSGAILLGKLNCDEFAMGSSNETSAYGNVVNPYQKNGENLVPGGSSGGCSSAVSANLTSSTVGTDTGGSIRQPASFTGIVGLKPTYGRCSRWGIVAFASSLDQAGPMTKDVSDSALMLDVISGYDEKDSTSANIEKGDFLNSLNKNIKGLKVGIPKEYIVDNMPKEIQTLWDKGIEWMKESGAIIKNISLPNTKYALPTYYIVAPAEASSNLARYDGVKYGFRAPGKDLIEMYENTRAEGFGNEVKRRIMIGTYVLSSGYYDAYYKKAQQVRRLIKEDFDQAFEMVDCIVTPTSPTVAFNIGEKFDDPLTMYLSDVFTVSANVAGLPGISIPCGQVKKLPVGLQFLGKHFDEQTLLNVAHQVEQII